MRKDSNMQKMKSNIIIKNRKSQKKDILRHLTLLDSSLSEIIQIAMSSPNIMKSIQMMMGTKKISIETALDKRTYLECDSSGNILMQIGSLQGLNSMFPLLGLSLQTVIAEQLALVISGVSKLESLPKKRSSSTCKKVCQRVWNMKKKVWEKFPLN